MILAYAFALHTLLGARVETTEIAVHYKRPSKILAQLKDGDLVDSEVTADDVKSVLIVHGTAEDARGIQTYVNLFDVRPRSVNLKVSVDSKIDKLSYQCDVKMVNNQMWRTTDSEIGVDIAVAPRLNDDNTVTFNIQLGLQGKKPVSIIVRGKLNESLLFSIGKNGPKYIFGPNSENTPKLNGAEAIDPQVKISANAY